MKEKIKKITAQTKTSRKKTLGVFGLVSSMLLLAIPTIAYAQFDILSSVFTFAETSIAWLLSIFAYAITYVLGKLLVGVIVVLVGVLQYNNFISESVVVIGWAIVRDFMNLFFVVALMIIAFATVFRIQAYHYKSMLPKLVIAAIVVNFSKVITGALIDVSQVLMLTFVHSFQAIAAGNMAELFGIDKLLSFGTFTAIQSGAIGLPSIMVSLALAIILLWVALVVVLIMIVVLVVRIVMLWILTIFSPIAWVAPLLPGGAQYASQWWSELSRHLITGVIMAFLLWLTFASLQIGGALTGEVPNVGDRDKSGVSQGVSSEESEFAFAASEIGTYEGMFTFIVSIVMLIATVAVAQQMGGAAGGVVGKVSNGIIQGNIKAGVKGLQFGGRKLDQFQRSVQRRALKGDIPILNRFKATRDAAKWTAGLLTGETRKKRAEANIKKANQAKGGADTIADEGDNLAGIKRGDTLIEAEKKVSQKKEVYSEQLSDKKRSIEEEESKIIALEKLQKLYDLQDAGNITPAQRAEMAELKQVTGITDKGQIESRKNRIKMNLTAEKIDFENIDKDKKKVEKQEEVLNKRKAEIQSQYAYEPSRIEYAFQKAASHGLTLNPTEIAEGVKIMNARRLRDEKLGLAEGIHDAVSAVADFKTLTAPFRKKHRGTFERKTMQMQADSMLINERKKEMMEKTQGETDLMLAELNTAMKSGKKADTLAAVEILAENLDINEIMKDSGNIELMKEALMQTEVDVVQKKDGKEVLDKHGNVKTTRRAMNGKEAEALMTRWKDNGEVSHAFTHQMINHILMKTYGNDEDAAGREGSRIGVAGIGAGNIFLYGNSRYKPDTKSYEIKRMIMEENQNVDGSIDVNLKMPHETVSNQSGKFRNLNIRRYFAILHPNNLANESSAGRMQGLSDFGEAFFTRDMNATLLDTFEKRAGEMRQDFAKLAESPQFMEDLRNLADGLQNDILTQRKYINKGWVNDKLEATRRGQQIESWMKTMETKYGRYT